MLRSHSTPLATTTTNSSSVLLSPRYDCKSPRSLYHSKHIQKKKKSPLSTTCFILCVFVFCMMVVLHRMEVIFVHRVGGTFSLLGSNRHQRCKHSIVSLCILGIFLLGVSDRGRYTRGVFQSRVENIRRIYGVFIRTGRGRSRVSFIRRVLLEVFIEERLFGQV